MVLSGHPRGKGSNGNDIFEAVIAAVPVIPYTEQTAYHHAHIWARLGAPAKRSSSYDLMSGGNSLRAREHRGYLQQASLFASEGASGP